MSFVFTMRVHSTCVEQFSHAWLDEMPMLRTPIGSYTHVSGFNFKADLAASR